MSQPTPYTPTTDFSQQEANNASGRSTVNTAALDAEFAAIDTTLDQTLANIQLLQRDDGRLMDVSVEMHTLSPEVLNLMGGFNLRGAWLSNTDYSVNDLVSSGSYTYVCSVAHNSGPTFSETNWLKFGFAGSNDAAQAAAAAAVSANEAHISELAAAASASSASGFATTATTQAGLASSSATAADASADAAAISETNAVNAASAAAASAANLPNATTAGPDKFLQSNPTGTAWEYKTASQARSSLGSTSVGDAVFVASDAATARSALGLVIGTNVLAPNGDGSLLTGVVPTIADNSITPAKLTQPLTLGTAQATTSGTSKDFTGIPSWVKRITVNFSTVSTNGASFLLVQIGDSGGIETTAYDSTSTHATSGVGSTNSTAGFIIDQVGSAGVILNGSMTICLQDDTTNTWVASGCFGGSGSYTQTAFMGGAKSLSATLDRIRLTTVNGTDTFDSGSVNIMYE